MPSKSSFLAASSAVLSLRVVCAAITRDPSGVIVAPKIRAGGVPVVDVSLITRASSRVLATPVSSSTGSRGPEQAQATFAFGVASGEPLGSAPIDRTLHPHPSGTAL